MIKTLIALQHAKALADEPIDGGVSEDRIVVEGRGEDERRINRRVEFFIIRR